MTRRSIFKSLTACVVASAMNVFGVKPKGILDLMAEEIGVNPAYINAEYEDLFIGVAYHRVHLDRLVFQPNNLHAKPRYSWDGKKWIAEPESSR